MRGTSRAQSDREAQSGNETGRHEKSRRPVFLRQLFSHAAPSQAPLGIRVFLRARLLLRRADRNQLFVRRAQRFVIAESAAKSWLRGKFARANQVRYLRDFLPG